ncbi:MAG: hypothetical protein CMM58_09745 [Rhodospirillaceae bacterium]|nr:hypothetical protein [Rhodospirillaceae bacterium]|tara:strand:+ start:5334 stop:7361 length:2028 start_codon:yes stop_codon:yes gene_type:complete
MTDHFAEVSSKTELLKEKYINAMDLHEAGSLLEAEALYEELLPILPTNALLLNSYGTLLYQQGRRATALQYLLKSILMQPDMAIYYNRFGAVLRADEETTAEARVAYKRAILIDAFLYEAHLNLAGLLLDLGHGKEALNSAKIAAEIRPNDWMARLRFGMSLRGSGKYMEAWGEADAAKSLNPLAGEVYLELCVLSLLLGKGNEGTSFAQKGIILTPEKQQFYAQLAGAINLLREKEITDIRLNGAVSCIKGDKIDLGLWGRRSLILSPVDPFLRHLYALDCQEKNLMSRGLENSKRAVLLDPSNGSFYYHLAGLFQKMGCLDDAFLFSRLVSKIFQHTAPNNHILWETSFALGRSREAWLHWEKRFETHSAPRRLGLPSRKWDLGSSLTKPLLVCSEQGIGDEILYLSCLPDLITDYEKLVVECDVRWGALFKRSFPDVTIIPRQTSLDENEQPFYDYYEVVAKHDIGAYLLSGDLPRFYRSDFTVAPPASGYLKPDQQRCRTFANYLNKSADEKLIGICWRSGFAPAWPFIYPELRDIVTNMPDGHYRLINLQYGAFSSEFKTIFEECGVDIEQIPDLDQIDDLDGVAALMGCLDLVISTSSTVLHLACALGIKTISTYYPNFRSSEGTDPLFGNCYPMLLPDESFCSKIVSQRTGKAVKDFLKEWSIRVKNR